MSVSDADKRDSRLREYVGLIVKSGINVQKGQNIVVSSPVECAGFTRLAVEEAYKAGAREVFVRWYDDACARSRYLLGGDGIFDDYPKWVGDMMNGLSEEGAGFISVSASDPEIFKGVDPERLRRANRAGNEALAPFRGRTMKNSVSWCVVSVPTADWAGKVFPNAGGSATDKLWDAIFDACEVGDGLAVANWDKRVRRITKSCQTLNEARFKALRYKNASGTDLTVELPEGHIWLGGSERTTGVIGASFPFSANIPTEEAFTAPKRDGVNGVVVSSLPFIYNGNVVDRFSLTFKDGKVTDFAADKEEDKKLIKMLLESEKNVDRLGEVALVPYSSAISRMGILFYNTLYDENASCHFALGRAYSDCVKGAESLSDEEFETAGLNFCLEHHDFMVGTSDLSIVGTDGSGKETDVFVNGDFTPDFV